MVWWCSGSGLAASVTAETCRALFSHEPPSLISPCLHSFPLFSALSITLLPSSFLTDPELSVWTAGFQRRWVYRATGFTSLPHHTVQINHLSHSWHKHLQINHVQEKQWNGPWEKVHLWFGAALITWMCFGGSSGLRWRPSYHKSLTVLQVLVIFQRAKGVLSVTWMILECS